MQARRAIGIDLGCTNIKGVLVDGEGTIINEAKAETNEKDDKHWKSAVTNMIRGFIKESGGNVDAIGLSAPGLADPHNQCISFMPGRLPGLENFIWADVIKQQVFVLNDAHAAIMAEATFGAAKGLKHAALLSLGTGVGGGILIDGQLYQGVFQMAGHIGHSTVDADTLSQDVTNMPGSIENAIGNLTLPERSYGRYHNTEDLVDDFRKGDHIATWIWLSSVRKLAVTIASVINILSPEAIILSGGIIQAQDALLEPLREFLSLYEWRPGGKQTPVKLALFSDRAGAIGAAGFALSKLK
ncbi:MAG TPA: ROK family protein [Chryseolinea sp.]|nr:ROK family protein [Chryseolinea sp.]